MKWFSLCEACLVLGFSVTVLGLAAASAKAQEAQDEPNPLLNPAAEQMNEQAPDVYTAKFETTKGDILIEVHRDWAPRGADRFYNLVQGGFYEGCRFFRVIENFMAQVGLNGDPAVTTAWMRANILDDPVVRSNTRGYVTYAKSAAPNSRTTQIFINYKDNSFLDQSGFAPFGRVVEGMDVVDALYSGYGEAAPRGRGPNQGKIMQEGNAYLEKDFPKLDFIESCSIVSHEAHQKEG